MSEELTLDTLRETIRSFRPSPQMPRWKDLTWAQRNMVEREINATENQVVRGAMREAYYCADDQCPYHAQAARTDDAAGGEG